MGKAISLRVSNLPAKACKVVKQIETSCLSDPIMRRPCADREEKRVTHGNETIKKRVTIGTGRLDASDPNQRRLLISDCVLNQELRKPEDDTLNSEINLRPLADVLQGRKLILHAGTPKTGTTALQRWLMLNQKAFCQKGVLYPSNVASPSKPKHQWLLESLDSKNYNVFVDNVEKIRAELSREQAKNPIDTVVLSTEGLYNHFDDIVIKRKENLMCLAASCSICVIVTFRNAFDFALSRYCQNLVNPPSSNPFHATKLTLEDLCDNQKWLNSLDYGYFMQFWEEIVGVESVKCIPYSLFSPTAFCSAAQINEPNYALPPTKENVSFSRLGAELIRTINSLDLSPTLRQKSVSRVLTIEEELRAQSLPKLFHTEKSKHTIKNFCRKKHIQLVAARPELTTELFCDLMAIENENEPLLDNNRSNSAFICCIEPGFLEEQVVRLAQSIRLFAGRYRNRPIYAISPCGDNLSPASIHLLESLNVTIIVIHLNRILKSFGYANKSYALEYIENTFAHDVYIIIDSDTLFLNEPESFNLIQRFDFLARPVDLRGISRSVCDNLFDDYWRECCDIAEVSLDDFAVITTTIDQAPIYANFNGGLLVIKGGNNVGAKWRQLIEKLWENRIFPNPKNFWGAGQVSFSLAVVSLKLNGGILPQSYNIPMHLNPSEAKINQINRPIHLHYHWMFEEGHYSELITRIKSMDISELADLYVSNIQPFKLKRGESITGL